MSWLYSAALVEAYSGASSLDGKPSAQLNVMHTQRPFLHNGKTMDFSSLSRYGVTSKPLTLVHGEELLKLYLAGFHAKTSRSSGKVTVSKENAPGYGLKWRELQVAFDRDSYSWKTRQLLLDGGSEGYLETFPSWGTMRSGELLERMTPVFPIVASESGFWATPSARDWKDTPGMSKERGGGRHRIDQLPRQVYASLDGSRLFTPVTATRMDSALDVDMILQIAGVPALPWKSVSTENGTEISSPDRASISLNPTWVEYLMDLPLGWTDLRPLATHKFQTWLDSHGKC